MFTIFQHFSKYHLLSSTEERNLNRSGKSEGKVIGDSFYFGVNYPFSSKAIHQTQNIVKKS